MVCILIALLSSIVRVAIPVYVPYSGNNCPLPELKYLLDHLYTSCAKQTCAFGACADARSDQGIRCPLPESLDTIE